MQHLDLIARALYELCAEADTRGEIEVFITMADYTDKMRLMERIQREMHHQQMVALTTGVDCVDLTQVTVKPVYPDTLVMRGIKFRIVG